MELSAEDSISPLTFFLYVVYLAAFFLHIGARSDVIGAIHPTVVLIALITVLLVAQSNRLKKRLSDPIIRVMLILVAWVIISLPFVVYPGSFVREKWEPFTSAISFIFFTVLIVDSRRRMAWTLTTLLACQLFRVFEPLYLHVTTGYWGDKASLFSGDSVMYRLSGAPSDVINPNGLGFVIVSVLPFLHYLAVAQKSTLLKVLYWACLPLLLWALILTGSRSAAVVLGVFVLTVIWMSRRRIVAVVLVVAAALLLLPRLEEQAVDRYESIIGQGQGNVGTAQGRYEAMLNDFVVGMGAPYFGHGVGTSAEARFHEIGHYKVSHNMYGEAFIELGVPGLLLYLALIWRIGVRLSQLVKALPVGPSSSIDAAVVRALFSWFWIALVFSMAQYGVSEYHWYLLGGLTVAVSRLSISAPNGKVNSPAHEQTRRLAPNAWSQAR